MITELSTLFQQISTELPGVPAALLQQEFKKAEREACKDAAIWSGDFTFTTVEGVYDYEVTLPLDSDLVFVKELTDQNGNAVKARDYIVNLQVTDASELFDGYLVTPTHEGSAPDPTVLGEYHNTGDTLHGEPVYRLSGDAYTLFLMNTRVVISTTAEYDIYAATLNPAHFPVNYLSKVENYLEFPGVLSCSLSGPLYGYVQSVDYNVHNRFVGFSLAPKLVDGGEYGTFTASLVLTPQNGFSAAPETVLSFHSDLIQQIALRNLLKYPRNFPWSNAEKAADVATGVRRLKSKAKQEPYRPFKRATLKMRPVSFI